MVGGTLAAALSALAFSAVSFFSRAACSLSALVFSAASFFSRAASSLAFAAAALASSLALVAAALSSTFFKAAHFLSQPALSFFSVKMSGHGSSLLVGPVAYRVNPNKQTKRQLRVKSAVDSKQLRERTDWGRDRNHSQWNCMTIGCSNDESE